MTNEQIKQALNEIIALAIKQVSTMPINEINQAIKGIYGVQQQIEAKLVD